MLKSKPRKKVSKRKNPCPPFICGFNPSTKKTRFKRNPSESFLEEADHLRGEIRFKLNQYDFSNYYLESEELKRIILSNLRHIQTITSDLTRKWKP